MVELCSPKRYVQVQSPDTFKCDLTWQQGLCRCNQVRSQWNTVDPKSSLTGVLIRKGGETDT